MGIVVFVVDEYDWGVNGREQMLMRQREMCLVREKKRGETKRGKWIYDSR
jgi:hypothetical protein